MSTTVPLIKLLTCRSAGTSLSLSFRSTVETLPGHVACSVTHSMRSRATDSLQGCSQGFGWAIAKALAEAGAEISLGVWVSTLAAALCVLHCLRNRKY